MIDYITIGKKLKDARKARKLTQKELAILFKRKETNERLISRKGMVGKVIGFAPMVCLFVGYLIIPLVFIGLSSMSSSFSSLSKM